jgi:hypothetical protein
MDEAETPQAKQSSQWIVAATCAALVLLVTAGGMFAMRDRLLAEAREEAEAQTAAREKLAARVDTIQTSLDSFNNAPKADAEALGAIDAKLVELNATLESITARQDTLDKKLEEMKAVPVPAPVAFAPTPPAAAPTAQLAASPATLAVPDATLTELKLVALSGKPFAAELEAWLKAHPERAADAVPLQSIAEKGIVAEADLAKRLRDTLETISPSTSKAEDTSLIGKINTHMNGLVSIKKAGAADPYVNLRKAALSESLDTLVREAERLSEDKRAPLDSWLSDAKGRIKAVATLDLISGGGH